MGLTSSIAAVASITLAMSTSRIDPDADLVSNVTIMPSPSQALELENFLPYRLSILAQIVSESLHDLYAEPFALTVTQWRVMAALGRFAPLTASDVGQRIVMDKVAVSRAVAGLMERGLVERATDRADRRRASLRLSARGRAMHARIVPIALAYEERLYEALSAEERRSFDALTERLFAHAKGLREAG
jgi:DNA-binding MarR family transcriptional regulator